MRRVLLGVATGAVVALAAATGVSAYWQAQVAVRGDVVTSGDLSISADWVGGTPSWTDLYPGQTTSDAVIQVTSTSAGDNLTWKVRVTDAVAEDFAPYATLQAWVGACGAGNLIPADGYGAFTSSTTTVNICVRYTLSADAPSTLQGQALNPTITVSAEQVTP